MIWSTGNQSQMSRQPTIKISRAETTAREEDTGGCEPNLRTPSSSISKVSPLHTRSGSDARRKSSNSCTSRLINMRCTDRPIAISALVIGVGVICLQTLALSTDRWIYVTEPMAVNDTIDIRSQEFALFLFNIGYWQMCKDKAKDQDVNLTAEAKPIIDNFKSFCVPNNIFGDSTNLDNNAYGKVAAPIMVRIRKSVGIHVISLAFTIGGAILALIGYAQKNAKWLQAAVIYIFSGLSFGTAVMHLICVTDDEMSSHRKQTPEGKPSRYDFDYGWSCLSASVCFLGMQYCAMIDLILYFRQFPSLDDKLRMVPGLRDKIKHAYAHAKELGVSPTPSRSSTRRNSRRSSLHSPHMYYTDLV